MIFRLHKTLSLLASLRAFGSRPFKIDLLLCTDSGTSSFAALIESLELRSTTMIVPAYICNSFAPVLRAYDISPMFVDADERTGNISVSHLEQMITTHTDIQSALLCPVYGIPLDTRIQSLLNEHKIHSIYDLSHCYQDIMRALRGQSQYTYAFASLSKTLPVLQGGLAVGVNRNTVQTEKTRSASVFTRIKKELQLLKIPGFFLYKARLSHQKAYTTLTFHGIRALSRRNRQLITWHMHHTHDEHRPYAYALLSENPDNVVPQLVNRGIEARRIWSEPLVYAYIDDQSQYPTTKKLAERVVCVPASNDTKYLQTLKHALEDYPAKWLNEPEW